MISNPVMIITVLVGWIMTLMVSILVINILDCNNLLTVEIHNECVNTVYFSVIILFSGMVAISIFGFSFNKLFRLTEQQKEIKE